MRMHYLEDKDFRLIGDCLGYSEATEHRGTKRYFINHHNKLLPEDEVEALEVVPDTWYRYSRSEVSGQIRRQAVEAAFERYTEWETETKACYEKVAKELLEAGYTADYEKIRCLLCDVDKELKKLDRLVLCLKSVSYNDVYMATIQDGIHEKYKEKTKALGIDIC